MRVGRGGGGAGAEGGVQGLEGADGDVAADESFDALDGCGGALRRGDARDGPRYRRGANLVPVHPRTGVAVRGVDNHMDLPCVDQVNDVVRSFEVLAHDSAGDAVAAQRVRGSPGSENFKTEISQARGRE